MRKSKEVRLNDLLEAVADIAYQAGVLRYYGGDSRADISFFIDLAKEFEEKHKKNDWIDGDYIDKIEAFSNEKLGFNKFLRQGTEIVSLIEKEIDHLSEKGKPYKIKLGMRGHLESVCHNSYEVVFPSLNPNYSVTLHHFQVEKAPGRGYALWAAKKNCGYAVKVYNQKGEMVSECSCGDSAHDSTVFNTGETPLPKLKQWAKETALQMMKEKKLVGKIEQDKALLSELGEDTIDGGTR